MYSSDKVVSRPKKKPVYKRVLLKLTGELFGEKNRRGVSFSQAGKVAEYLHTLSSNWDIELAIVLGAGNLFRGRDVSSERKIDKATADYIGMLGTVMNALALQEELERRGSETRVLSPLEIKAVCEPFRRRRALHHLEKGRIVILAGGTGSPFFTTDSAAALKAAELGCGIILKGSNVDGVYSEDPKKNKKATKFRKLSYQEALERGLTVMDNTAFALCQRERIPIVVFNISQMENIERVIAGEEVGTLVS